MKNSDWYKFMQDWPTLAIAVKVAIDARRPGSSFSIEGNVSEGSKAIFDAAEEYCRTLSPSEIDEVTTDIENAQLLGLADRPGFSEFDTALNICFNSFSHELH